MSAQARKPASRPAPRTVKPSASRTEPVALTCPQVLGTGLATRRVFCDVLVGRDPAQGILIRIPPHKGTAILTFDLHNRHTYSEELVRARRAYTAYTATVGLLTKEGDLVTRGVVQTEFRTARDLFDRVGGGAGPGGAKAVAPTGIEPLRIQVPEGYDELSLLGEKLSVVTLSGTDLFTSTGRPIAVVSNAWVEYTPAPKAPARKPAPKKPAPRKR